jgi:hypothetical protein
MDITTETIPGLPVDDWPYLNAGVASNGDLYVVMSSSNPTKSSGLDLARFYVAVKRAGVWTTRTVYPSSDLRHLHIVPHPTSSGGAYVVGSTGVYWADAGLTNPFPPGVSDYLIDRVTGWYSADWTTTAPTEFAISQIPQAAGTTGTASGGSASTLAVSGTPWTTDQWAGWYVKITSGTGAGSWAAITSNTPNTVVVSSWSATAPTSGSGFQITDWVIAGQRDSIIDASGRLHVAQSWGDHNGRFRAKHFIVNGTSVTDLGYMTNCDGRSANAVRWVMASNNAMYAITNPSPHFYVFPCDADGHPNPPSPSGGLTPALTPDGAFFVAARRIGTTTLTNSADLVYTHSDNQLCVARINLGATASLAFSESVATGEQGGDAGTGWGNFQGRVGRAADGKLYAVSQAPGMDYLAHAYRLYTRSGTNAWELLISGVSGREPASLVLDPNDSSKPHLFTHPGGVQQHSTLTLSSVQSTRSVPVSLQLIGANRFSRSVPAALQTVTPPPNDMPPGAYQITPSSMTVDVLRTNATATNEPVSTLGTLKKTVWYRLRTITGGTLGVSFSEPGVRGAVVVFARNAQNPPSYTQVAAAAASTVGAVVSVSAQLGPLTDYFLEFGEL